MLHILLFTCWVQNKSPAYQSPNDNLNAKSEVQHHYCLYHHSGAVEDTCLVGCDSGTVHAVPGYLECQGHKPE
jgi:hypothetical protein